MRTTATGVLALLTLGLGGCVITPKVNLDAPPGDLQKLVGKWEGTYVGAHAGPSGSISFTLKSGADHAQGEVLMVPQGAQKGFSAYPGPQSPVPSTVALKIDFVRAYAGSVSGTLDKYWDPDTKCATYTTFRGTQDGDVIAGTYSSTCENTLTTTTGTWRVTRKP